MLDFNFNNFYNGGYKQKAMEVTMNALVHFNKHLRKLFDHPQFEGFGWEHPLEQAFKSHSLDYSVFKHQEEGAWYIELPVPGMTEKDIKVEVDPKERKLRVSATKSEKESQEDEKIKWTKRAQLDRSYSFDLEENLDIQTLEAKCENGILTLKIKELNVQKPEEVRRQIQVAGPSN